MSLRWMERLYWCPQAFTGESGIKVASSEFVARGPLALCRKTEVATEHNT
jgi:hypothetical protein